MVEIGLILAASLAFQEAQPPSQPQTQPQTQPRTATLESCEYVDERWVCRYRLPEIQLVESGVGPTTLQAVPLPVSAPPSESPDPGVLSEAEVELVARCAEARWLSLCFPSQRTEARRLRDQARAYEEARQRVGVLIGEGECQAAFTHALNGGYLGLARESQALCAAPAGEAE